MAKISAVVYDPPSSEFPHIAVVFYGEEVLVARRVPSLKAGDEFLAEVMPQVAAKIEADRKAKK